jgi:putative PIN family toxin of toxin-antitoxin system
MLLATIRVTADTNVFISGLNFKGKPFELLTLARSGRIELSISDSILTEVKRVLGLKFHWPEEDIATIEKQIRSFTRFVQPREIVDLVKEDPTDNRILECAAAAGSEFVVSGDNHLLKLGSFGEIPILTVAQFLGELDKIIPAG